jgi:predicted MFS family arabinose efflux permease
VPLPVLVGLLFTVTMISTPFTSARSGMYPDILPGDSFALGTAVTMTTYQVALVAGFAGGGAAVGFFGVRPCLLADAVTFGISALIASIWVRPRPAARPGGAAGREPRRGGMTAGVRMAFGRPALRTPMLLGCLATFYVAPEGIAAPLAHSLGAGTLATGMILTAGALGPSVGAVAFTRLVRPAVRTTLMRPLAIACCATLMLFALQPPLPLALLIIVVSGLFDCYQVPAVAAFVHAAPASHRSQLFGVAQAAMSLGQGAAMIAAGAIAEHVSPSATIALSGAVGAVAAVLISAGPG